MKTNRPSQDEDDYIEKRAGSLSLAVDDNDADSLVFGLGGVVFTTTDAEPD